MATITSQVRIQHLYLRAGFGEKPSVVRVDLRKPIKSVVKKLFQDSRTYTPLRVVEENLVSRRELKAMAGQESEGIREEIKRVVQESRTQLKQLNLQWLDRMAYGPDALRQKMTLFWHGHFACQSRHPFFAQQYINTLQQHALGNFGDLLKAVAKSPAMLQFLNNQQNRKNSPNENFAREVMELFTMGRGNYTEDDVKNAAKAFTGWGFTSEGAYVFRPHQHDGGPKTFFGKTDKFTGENIIEMILKKKETALFISQKIFRYFVNDQIDARQVQALANRFYQSGYDIRDLLEHLFTSEWFYDARNLGARIKSPLELIAGMSRTLEVRFEEKESLLFIQKVLGQVAFHPPSVAGWPEGRNWIDSSSLLFRMKLPEAIFQASEVTTEAKEEGDADTDHLFRRKESRLQATIQWSEWMNTFAAYPEKEVLDQLSAYLLQVPLSPGQKKVVENRVAESAGREERLKQFTLGLLMLPEYQLC